jgi:hypothetical protein
MRAVPFSLAESTQRPSGAKVAASAPATRSKSTELT